MFKQIGLILIVLTSITQAETFSIDKERSKVSFEALYLGLSNIEGVFKDIEAKWTTKNNRLSKIIISAKTNSLDSGSQKRDSYIKNQLIKSSSIKFSSSSISSNRITGKLAINGIIKTVSFNIQNSKIIRDPLSKSRTKRSGVVMSTVINRSDFKISDDYSDKTLSKKLKVMINLQGTP